MGFFDRLDEVFRMGFGGAFVLLPLLAGMVVTIVGIRQLFLEGIGHKIRATATCIGVEWKRPAFNSRGDRGPTACPRLRVELDGKAYELFNGAYSSSHTGISVGREVPIRIAPNNPDDYYIIELLTPGRTCLFFGLLLIALGAIAYSAYFR